MDIPKFLKKLKKARKQGNYNFAIVGRLICAVNENNSLLNVFEVVANHRRKHHEVLIQNNAAIERLGLSEQDYRKVQTATHCRGKKKLRKDILACLKLTQ